MISNDMPIIPFKEMGGIKLYSTILDLKIQIDKIDAERKKGDPYYLIKKSDVDVTYDFKTVYETQYLYLFYNLLNGKLYKITTKKGYKGTWLDKIYIGMPIKEALAQMPLVKYDDMEEIYYSEEAGIFIENDAEVTFLSIYVKEMDTLDVHDFHNGKW